MALSRLLLAAAAVAAFMLPGLANAAPGASEGWRDVPFTGTVTVKRTVNYEGAGDITNSQAKVRIEETMVVRVSGAKAVRKAGGRLDGYRAIGTFDVNCTGSTEMKVDGIGFSSEWSVNQTHTPDKGDKKWTTLALDQKRKILKITIPNAGARGGTKKNTVNMAGQVQSENVEAECAFQFITKDGVGRIQHALSGARGSRLQGTQSYTKTETAAGAGFVRPIPVQYAISWDLDYGAGEAEDLPLASAPAPAPKQPEGFSIEYAHEGKWKWRGTRYEMKVGGFVPFVIKPQRFVEHWTETHYQPAVISSVSGSGEVPFALTTRIRNCRLVMKGVIGVTLEGKEWPKHHHEIDPASPVRRRHHTRYRTLNVALIEEWKIQRGELRCPKRAPKVMPAIPRRLMAIGKLMPGAGGTNRTLEYITTPTAGRILRSKALPTQFKGKAEMSWRLHTTGAGEHAKSVGEGSKGKGIHYEGSEHDPSYELPRPDLGQPAIWGPPLDQVPDCGPGYCGSRPCCRNSSSVEDQRKAKRQ